MFLYFYVYAVTIPLALTITNINTGISMYNVISENRIISIMFKRVSYFNILFMQEQYARYAIDTKLIFVGSIL